MNKVLGEVLTPPQPETLEPALQQAVFREGEIGKSPTSLLLNTPQGLLFQEQEGLHLLTRKLDASNIAGHRIDLQNMMLY